jgi:hypothetical protein
MDGSKQPRTKKTVAGVCLFCRFSISLFVCLFVFTVFGMSVSDCSGKDKCKGKGNAQQQ